MHTQTIQRTDDGWLEVDEHSSGHMFAGASLAEERVKRVVTTANRLVTRHLSVRLDAMLQTVQLPACIANLHSGLADVDTDTFTLKTSKSLEIGGAFFGMFSIMWTHASS